MKPMEGFAADALAGPPWNGFTHNGRGFKGPASRHGRRRCVFSGISLYSWPDFLRQRLEKKAEYHHDQDPRDDEEPMIDQTRK